MSGDSGGACCVPASLPPSALCSVLGRVHRGPVLHSVSVSLRVCSPNRSFVFVRVHVPPYQGFRVTA